MARLRRTKNNLRKTGPKNKKKRIIKATISKKTKGRKIVKREEIREEILGTREMAQEERRLFYSEPAKVTHPLLKGLPSQYGEDKIILQVRDPWWIYAYWEIRGQTLQGLKKELGPEFYRAKRILRVYDVSYIIFDGLNAHRFFDIQINEGANNWYIDTGGPGRSWCVDLGLLLCDGRFITILRSNTVHTPLDGPSWITDEEWMVCQDLFARLYGLGFGLGGSSPVGRAWQERAKKEFFAHLMGSAGIASLAHPVKKAPKK